MLKLTPKSGHTADQEVDFGHLIAKRQVLNPKTKIKKPRKRTKGSQPNEHRTSVPLSSNSLQRGWLLFSGDETRTTEFGGVVNSIQFGLGVNFLVLVPENGDTQPSDHSCNLRQYQSPHRPQHRHRRRCQHRPQHRHRRQTLL